MVGDYYMSSKAGVTQENFRITEINARFMFNALLHAAYGQQALDEAWLDGLGLVSTTDGEKVKS